jgi:hypothetical protein
MALLPFWFEEDAGPPCGHPASNSRAHDGALTGFGSIGNPTYVR